MASLVPDGSAAAEAHARRCIDPKTPPADALRLMIENKFRHLPVPFNSSIQSLKWNRQIDLATKPLRAARAHARPWRRRAWAMGL